MNGVKGQTMGRRFKDVSIGQLDELMNALNEKIKASCLKDALLFAQAYAAAEELRDIKIKRAEEQPND